MDDNPFGEIVKTIREDSKKQVPSYYRLGNVITVSPLSIEINGTIQNGNALLKNYSLSVDIGDRVLLTPIEEEQRYIVICKVVDT